MYDVIARWLRPCNAGVQCLLLFAEFVEKSTSKPKLARWQLISFVNNKSTSSVLRQVLVENSSA